MYKNIPYTPTKAEIKEAQSFITNIQKNKFIIFYNNKNNEDKMMVAFYSAKDAYDSLNENKDIFDSMMITDSFLNSIYKIEEAQEILLNQINKKGARNDN